MSKDGFFNKFLYLVLVFYAFSIFSGKDLSELVLSVFFISIFIEAYNKRLNIKYIFPYAVVLLSLVIGLLTWLLTSKQEPEIATRSPRLEMLLIKFAFIPFAFVLNDKKRVFSLWMFVVIFAFLTPWLSGEGTATIKDVFDGARSGLGNHIITMGMVYSVIFIGLLVFYKFFLKCKYSKLGWFFWVFCLSFSAFGVFASQTRAIYFAFIIVYLLSVGLSLYLYLFKKKVYGKYVVFNIVLIVFVFVVNDFGVFESVKYRFLKEQATIIKVMSLDYEMMPKNSTGLRVQFWMEAWEWIKQRPWTGWGESANHALHAKQGNYFGNRHFITIHNDMLEILLAYGIFGLLLFFATLSWLTYRLHNAWLRSKIDTDFFVFYCIFICFFIINGFFMSVLFFKESLLLWNIVLASYLGLVLREDNKVEGKENDLH